MFQNFFISLFQKSIANIETISIRTKENIEYLSILTNFNNKSYEENRSI